MIKKIKSNFFLKLKNLIHSKRKQAQRLITRFKIRRKHHLIIHYNGKTLKFETKSYIAKSWFYPRYLSGKKVHEPLVAWLIEENLKCTDTFFDVGANLGFFTVLAANLCDVNNSQIHAFEMDPHLIPLIENSLLLNDDIPSIFVNCFACTNQNGKISEFSAQQINNPSTNQLHKKNNADRKDLPSISHRVLSMTLDEYCKQVDVYPDFLKVDIEGSELYAIRGMQQLLKKNKPKLILEVHPSSIFNYGGTMEEVINPILKLGYKGKIAESYRKEIYSKKVLNRLRPLNISEISDKKPTVLFFE